MKVRKLNYAWFIGLVLLFAMVIMGGLSCSSSGSGSPPTATTQVVPPPDTQAPTIPTNLTATAISSSQIDLSWTASTDNTAVAGYKIYRGGTLLTTSVNTSYSGTGLAESTTYTYTVSAYDSANNESSQSTSASATTPQATQQSVGDLAIRYASAKAGPNRGLEGSATK